MKSILNLGCGNKKLPEEIGVDIIATNATDIICDLSMPPLPFDENSIDEIRSNHFLEHLDNVVAIMEEVHRILKPGGIIKTTVPHVSNIEFFRDPTHKTAFTYGSFDYFVRDRKPVAYTTIEFEYISREMKFSNGLRGKIGKLLFNISPRKWEKYYAWKYPCYEMTVVLRALK